MYFINSSNGMFELTWTQIWILSNWVKAIAGTCKCWPNKWFDLTQVLWTCNNLLLHIICFPYLYEKGKPKYFNRMFPIFFFLQFKLLDLKVKLVIKRRLLTHFLVSTFTCNGCFIGFPVGDHSIWLYSLWYWSYTFTFFQQNK